MNLEQSLPNINLVTLCKGLPAVGTMQFDCVESINVAQPTAVHIFSNILDIGTINLKELAKVISSTGHKHIVSCVGPANCQEDRINTFCQNFDRMQRLFKRLFVIPNFFIVKAMAGTDLVALSVTSAFR
jgi:ATP-dependent DNA helicase RecQ